MLVSTPARASAPRASQKTSTNEGISMARIEIKSEITGTV